jgi:hypothetical protein
LGSRWTSWWKGIENVLPPVLIQQPSWA